MDSLNTHSTASLYQAFPPYEARRLAEKLEIHHTPKHASRLNMAEIEISVLARQCLAGYSISADDMHRNVNAWQFRRNSTCLSVDWQFTTADARIKLKKLYPFLSLLLAGLSTTALICFSVKEP